MQQLEIAGRSHCSRSVFHANALTINPKGHAIAPDPLPVMHNNRTICMWISLTFLCKNTNNSASHWHKMQLLINTIRTHEWEKKDVMLPYHWYVNVIQTYHIRVHFIRPFSFSRHESNACAVCEHQPRVGHERAGAERQSSSMSVVRIVSRLSLRSYPGPF